MKENRLIMILGLAGFVVMADNWVVSPILPAIANKYLKISWLGRSDCGHFSFYGSG